MSFEIVGAVEAWQRKGVDMSQEEFKTMMDELNTAEIERLGVGSQEFQQRHQEIMSMIQDVEDYQKERRERMEKSYITAKEIAEMLGISTGKSYQIIRDMNAELKAGGYLTISGKVSREYFNEKWYGNKVAD